MVKQKYTFWAFSMVMAVGLILSGDAYAERRMTNTGHVFIRDIDHPALGDAWRDESGLIWGDIVRDENGYVRYMVQSSEYMKDLGRPLPNDHLGAKEYCESISARLPSKEEFTRLREYMGAQPGTPEGYSHHHNKVLPNLSGYWFWSSSVDPNNSDYAYFFYGGYGDIDHDLRNYFNYGAVRCVVS